jgi:hypothetical protein
MRCSHRQAGWDKSAALAAGSPGHGESWRQLIQYSFDHPESGDDADPAGQDAGSQRQTTNCEE